MKTSRYAIGAATLTAAALLLTGCSGSSLKTGGAGSGATAADSGLPSSLSSALAKLTGSGGLAGPGSTLDVSKLCAAVSQADVQKLYKATAPKVTVEPGECDWGGGDVTVDVDLNDSAKKFYPGGAFSGSESVLSGVGDQALWSSPVKNMTIPFITARKGNNDCSISPGIDVDKSSIPYTGSDPFFKITDADELAYAQAEGQICNDIFKAAG